MKTYSWLLLFLFAALRLQVLAAGGDLDTTFTTGVTGVGGSIAAIAIQPDGRVLIGGSFTVVNGRSANRLARLNTDGTLDQSFNVGTGFNTSVNAIAVQADGRILVGGEFSNYNGTARSYLVRLNSDGALDTTFNVGGSGPGNQVDAIAIQPDGRILIGGFNFSQYNGITANRFARINFDGSLDTAFAANLGSGFDSSTSVIAVETDGRILVGGRFSTVNGIAASRLARLNADGTPDTAFLTNLGSGIAGGSFGLTAVAVQPDGRILIGGQITAVNGAARNNLARLNNDGTLDSNWANIAANGAIQRIETEPDGRFYILGENGVSFGLGASQRFTIARLNASDGSIDTSFNLTGGTNGTAMRAVVRQLDGTILIGGNFTTAGGAMRTSIAGLNADGSVNNGFSSVVGSAANVNAIRVLPDNRVLIAGNFRGANELIRANVARLNPDGTTDPTFNPGVGGSASSTVLAIAVQADGRVLLGGTFSSFGGGTNFGVVRLNTDGTRDATFTATTNGTVNAVVVQNDGRIVIGGNFTLVNGVLGVNRIARLNADGTRDTTFNTGSAFDATVETLVLQPNGQILAGGGFSAFNGAAANRIARLDANGSFDSGFALNIGSGFNVGVSVLSVLGDGRIIAAGSFATLNGAAANQVVRLNADGTRDPAFDTGSGFANSVVDLAVQDDGRIVCVGGFQTFNGVIRRNLARLNADGSLDSSFRSLVAINNSLDAVAIQPDGRILIGGGLQLYDSAPRFGIARVLAGETLTFTGAAGSDWNNGANWSGGAVPTANDNAAIPPNANVVMTAGNLSALTLTVAANASLTIAAGSSLSVEGGTNNGVIAGSGTLNFIGAAFGNNGTISVAAFNVTNGTGGGKSLNGAGEFLGNRVTVAPNITLALQNNQRFHEINLQNGAILDATSRVVGLRGPNPLQGTGALLNNFGTVIFEGATAQSITRSVNFNNLTINNPAGVSFGGSGFYFVGGTLELIDGILDLGVGSITIDTLANVTRTNGYVRGRVVKRFSAAAPTFTYPIGTANGYSPVEITMTSGFNEAAATVFETNQPSLDPATSLRRYWNLSANSSGFTANLTFNYRQSDVAGVENRYGIYRVAGGLAQPFVNRCNVGSPCVDTNANTARIDGVTQFSDWTLGEFVPTAANVSIGGRVTTASGNAIARAMVSLTDASGAVRVVTTNSFGFYRFNGVPAGATYIVGVRHGKIQFNPSTRVVDSADAGSDVDFIGEIK